MESPSTTTDPGPPLTSTPVSSGQVPTVPVYAAPSASAAWSPGVLRYDFCTALSCSGTEGTAPGRCRLTSRSAPSSTASPTGSLTASAPAGSTVDSCPPKVSGTGVDRGSAPSARTATVALPTRTGVPAKVLESRTRAVGPDLVGLTTSRSVWSRHGPTSGSPAVDADQLPVQPSAAGRTRRSKTWSERPSPRTCGSRTDSTVRPASSGTVTTYSRGGPRRGPRGC